MAARPPDTPRRDADKSGPSRWRPLWTALAAIGAIILTVSGAFVLALQEMPAEVEPPPTQVGVQATTPPPVAAETPLSAPTPSPTGTPSMIPTFTPKPATSAVMPTSTPTSPPGTPVCQPPKDWVPYVVRPDDTLDLLAHRHGIDAAELMRANCLVNPRLVTGQILYLPRPVIPSPPTPECGPPEGWVRYTVQPGDTLESLAARTGTSIHWLAQANCLPTYIIYPGQQIWLPFLPPTPTTTFTLPPSTATYTPIVVTATPTPSPTIPPDTPTPTATWTPTATMLPPTPTFTMAPPTATATLPPTPTATDTPPPTSTATPTPPPTNTPAEFIPPPETSG